MNDADEQFLQLLRDEREIRQVIQTYGRGSDRKDFDLMRSAYHADAYDDHGPFRGPVREYFEWAKPHHEKFDTAVHLFGYPNVSVQGHIAFAETYCILLQRLKGAGGETPIPGQTVTMACRYVDRFEKREGAWKIAHRIVAYDWVRKEWHQDEFAPSRIGADYTVGTRSKEDPVYTLPLRGSAP